MQQAPLLKSVIRRLPLPLLLIAFGLASACAVAAPGQAPSVSTPRLQPAQTDPRAATGDSSQNAPRAETARAIAGGQETSVAANATSKSGTSDNSNLLKLLAASAVTLGLVAVATAFLLARTQAKLEAERLQRDAFEKDFDALYNRSPLGYHTLDLSGAVVDMNDTEVGWLGYARDQILGKRYAEFLDEASWTAFSENYGRILHGDRPEIMDHKYKIIGKDGQGRSLSLTPSIVRGDNNRIVETRWTAVDISETARLEQALDTEAHFDRVTNAHNRSFFYTLGEREIARARRLGAHLTLLYVDIDGFTRINSIYGHFAGDRVLRAVCGVIAEGLRNVDVFARVGDDEFAILLPDTSGEGAMIVAERLKVAIASTPVNLSADDVVEISAAIGIGEFSASTPDLDNLLTAGEKALDQDRRARREGIRKPRDEIKDAAQPHEASAT